MCFFFHFSQVASSGFTDNGHYEAHDEETEDNFDNGYSKVTNEKTEENLAEMMANSHERTSLKFIANKLMKLFFETKNKEEFQNILQNVNIINHPENLDLVEELISGCVIMYKDSTNHDLIKQFHVMQDMITRDDDVKETIGVMKESFLKIYSDKTAQRLLYSIVKSGKQMFALGSNLKGIFESSRSILADEEKLQFSRNLANSMEPMMKNINLLMPTDDVIEASNSILTPLLPNDNSVNLLANSQAKTPLASRTLMKIKANKNN